MATGTYSKSIQGLRQAVNKFRVLENVGAMSVANKNFTKQVADLLVKNININYDIFIASLGRDFQDRSDTQIYAIPSDDGYEVRVVGNQVIYDEFGTGDRGENKPHPKKGKYHLQPYNSGPQIKEGKTGHYWWYKSPVDLKLHTSHGVPSGQFMYHGLMETADDLEFLQTAFMQELKKMLGVK